jgi:hypothetical protein
MLSHTEKFLVEHRGLTAQQKMTPWAYRWIQLRLVRREFSILLVLAHHLIPLRHRPDRTQP